MPKIHIYRRRFDKEKSQLINDSLEETITYLIRNISWTLKPLNGMLVVTSGEQYIDTSKNEFHLNDIRKVVWKLDDFWSEILGVWYSFENVNRLLFVGPHSLLVLTGEGDDLQTHTFVEGD